MMSICGLDARACHTCLQKGDGSISWKSMNILVHPPTFQAQLVRFPLRGGYPTPAPAAPLDIQSDVLCFEVTVMRLHPVGRVMGIQDAHINPYRSMSHGCHLCKVIAWILRWSLECASQVIWMAVHQSTSHSKWLKSYGHVSLYIEGL